METLLAIGQGITKDCIVGNRLINRYAVFNGLEKPHRIDSNGEWQILGVRQANPATSLTAQTTANGALTAGWYAYVIVYASASHTRPVAVLDASGDYTRGNPSTATSAQLAGPQNSVRVDLPSINQAGITHVLVYRSVVATSQAEAEIGPFFFVGMEEMNVGYLDDEVADNDVGIVVENNNFQPSAWRYAVSTTGYIFAGGNIVLGDGATCTATIGSSTIIADKDIFYDGIFNWRFRVYEATSGGSNKAGVYFANYVDAHTLQLVDSAGNPVGYNGNISGSGLIFSVYLPGYILRWSKYGEPEAWPMENAIEFEGDITGIGEMPNQPLLLVFTDSPAIHVLDLNIISSDTFKTTKNTITSTYTTTSHYSICPVEGRLRAIDFSMKAIIETDGVRVVDISSPKVPRIFDYLKADMGDVKLWHCAYDQAQGFFGAFVTFSGAHRIVDFCIGQYVPTGSWFFNIEKDLLCSAKYRHPETGDCMIIGGTEGSGNGWGGVWGRIWAPNVYDEWIPTGCLRSGVITSVVNANQIEIDTTNGLLSTNNGGLAGRWVLVCSPNEEFAQLAYISSNTSNTINIESVIGGLDSFKLSPLPSAGYKFYIGLTECRWGPKRFDFGDPDVPKKVLEIWCTVEGHDENNLPFIRLYRGYETGYTSQLELEESVYLDRTQAQSLVNKVSNKLESVPRWGMAWYDRSYGPTTLSSISIVFNKVQ